VSPGDERGPSRLIAGIDEAGLGPLLGPLTVGFSVLRLPEPGADPWALLKGHVLRKPSRKDTALVVADSKQVYSRSASGLKRLEATVLSFLGLLQEGQRTPRDPAALLFGRLAPAAGLRELHPWYEHLPGIPRVLDPAALELKGALLLRKMQKSGVELLDAGVRTVPSGELNRSYRQTNNKGTTVWQYCRDLLVHIWDQHGEDDPDVTVDILGGRSHYAGLLQRGFIDASVHVLFEDPEHAAYILTEKEVSASTRWRPRRMRIDFRSKAEDHSFCVALSSCIAKYARELSMAGFNRYFEALTPGLIPTAGYTTDGRRWLEDAHQAIRLAALPDNILQRER